MIPEAVVLDAGPKREVGDEPGKREEHQDRDDLLPSRTNVSPPCEGFSTKRIEKEVS